MRDARNIPFFVRKTHESVENSRQVSIETGQEEVLFYYI